MKCIQCIHYYIITLHYLALDKMTVVKCGYSYKYYWKANLPFKTYIGYRRGFMKIYVKPK